MLDGKVEARTPPNEAVFRSEDDSSKRRSVSRMALERDLGGPSKSFKSSVPSLGAETVGPMRQQVRGGAELKGLLSLKLVKVCFLQEVCSIAADMLNLRVLFEMIRE